MTTFNTCKDYQDFMLAATPDSKPARSQASWDLVKKHTSQCADCAAFASDLYAGEIKRALSANISANRMMASHSLVVRTKVRCRRRAQELQQQGERMWPVWLASVMACMWAVASVPFLWQGFEWIGRHAELPAYMWQSLAVIAWLMPAGLLTSFALYMRGDKLLLNEVQDQ